ncbi:MAG: germination protein YpeB [Oscillospiraceae bacterium]|nr:germination protein YpeB [Oscillospiraceae bacterium]
METRRFIVLLISFNFAVIVILGGFVYQKHLELERFHLERAYAEDTALTQFAEHLTGIDLVLRKSEYATSSEVFAILGAQLYRRAALAAMALETLPLETEATTAFLVEVGRFARNFASTGDTAELSTLRTPLARSAFSYPSLVAFAALEESLAGYVAVFGSMAEIASTSVSEETALNAVAAFMGLNRSIFRPIGEHQFLARVDGGDFLAEVCGISGRVVRAGNSREVRTTVLTVEECLAQMAEFLTRNGYEDMILRHWRQEANQIAAHFVPSLNGVLLYPDAVQIRVGLDNGRVTGFSAAEMTQREPMSAVLTREEALAAIPPSLVVEDYDLALIPTASGQELLCFAFLARAEDGQAYRIYVSAETGRQQEIRLLAEDTMGVFVR